MWNESHLRNCGLSEKFDDGCLYSTNFHSRPNNQMLGAIMPTQP